MDLVDQLRIFGRVAHSGGFTQAAAQMDLPRPTVSLAVQQLESRLGVRLLNRTTRRVSLTQEGELLLERALALVADADELESQFRASGSALSGRLRVDMPSRVARRVVAPALPAFFERFPGIDLVLGSSDMLIDLVQEGVDCALRVGGLHPSSLVARPMGQLRVVHCASPAYLARHGTPRSPADLPAHLAVNYIAPTLGKAAPWEWMEDGKLHATHMNSRVSVNNAECYIACCLADQGLIQIPVFDVSEHLAKGELIEVLQPWPAPDMPVHLVYPHRRHLTARVQAFGNWLAEIMAAQLRT